MGEIDPRHVGHRVVGDHQSEALGGDPEGVQRLPTTGADHDLVAQAFQGRLAQAGEHGLIIDKQ